MPAALFGFRKIDRLPQWSVLAVLSLATIAGGWFGLTGYLGGEIRHTEVRPNFRGFSNAPSTGKAKEKD